MQKYLFLLLLPLMALFLNNCDDNSVKKRKMIVIVHHYPTYLSCGLPLELALDGTVFDDAVALEKSGDINCSDYGRDPKKNTMQKSCYMRDYHADTNDTCVIGVNYTDYADDMVNLIVGEANQTRK